MIKHYFLFTSLTILSVLCYGQRPEDMTLNVCAKTALYSLDTTKTIVTIFWRGSPTAALVQNYRFKTKTSLAWGAVKNIPLADTFFRDTIATGSEREYIVRKDTIAPSFPTNPSPLSKYGYILVGRKVPASLQPGRFLVLVDSNYLNALDSVLSRYKHDLIGDGYIPIIKYVSSTNSVKNIKQHILSYSSSGTSRLSGVVFLGHIPVPYAADFKASGYYPPDGHTTTSAPPSHEGAWATDLYYADTNSSALIWTDSYVNNTLGARAANNNTVGDKKFDATSLPSAVELPIGRVDLTGLPSFSQTDTQLMIRYLTKNHNYRAGKTPYRKRVLQDDELGLVTTEPFGGNSYQIGNPLYGDSIDKLDWNTTLQTNSYQFANGYGYGAYSGCSNVVSTSDFATNSYKAIFTTLFGSYFGDFDINDNLLRAALASDGDILTCAWSGRPKWYFHQMGTGNPIGLSVLMTQNTWNGSYPIYPDAQYGYGLVHQSFHGDVSLKLTPYESPQKFIVRQDSCNNRFKLSWNKSNAANVIAYIVQRSGNLDSSFLGKVVQRSDTFYTDSFPLTGSNIYMVRAIKEENTSSGMFYNLSHGAIDSIRFAIPKVNAGRDSLLCRNQAVQFGKDTVYTNPTIVHYWTPSMGLNDSTLFRPTWTATQSQNFAFHVVDTFSKCMVIDSTSISIIALPADTILLPTFYNGCGDTIDLSASTIGAGLNLNYSWTFDSAAPAFANGVGQKGPHTVFWPVVGNYKILMSVTDNLTSCTSSDSITHNVGCVLPLDLLSFSAKNNSSCDSLIVNWETREEANVIGYKIQFVSGNKDFLEIDIPQYKRVVTEKNTFAYHVSLPITNSFMSVVKLAEKSNTGFVKPVAEMLVDNFSCAKTNIFPNPFDLSKHNKLFIESNIRFPSVDLLDANGTMVLSIATQTNGNNFWVAIPKDVSAGIYFVKTQQKVYKIMLVK